MSITRPSPLAKTEQPTAQLAKAALRRLALERLEPTPENYERAYRQEAGEPPSDSTEALATLIERIAKNEYQESIGDMKHADALIERLLVLDALPNLQDLGKLLIGETLIEALQCDLQSERAAQTTVKDGIAQAELSRDFVSRAILERILDDTEEHIDFLETQLELVGKVGEQNYLQSQMGEPS